MLKGTVYTSCLFHCMCSHFDTSICTVDLNINILRRQNELATDVIGESDVDDERYKLIFSEEVEEQLKTNGFLYANMLNKEDQEVVANHFQTIVKKSGVRIVTNGTRRMVEVLYASCGPAMQHVIQKVVNVMQTLCPTYCAKDLPLESLEIQILENPPSDLDEAPEDGTYVLDEALQDVHADGCGDNLAAACVVKSGLKEGLNGTPTLFSGLPYVNFRRLSTQVLEKHCVSAEWWDAVVESTLQGITENSVSSGLRFLLKWVTLMLMVPSFRQNSCAIVFMN